MFYKLKVFILNVLGKHVFVRVYVGTKTGDV